MIIFVAALAFIILDVLVGIPAIFWIADVRAGKKEFFDRYEIAGMAPPSRRGYQQYIAEQQAGMDMAWMQSMLANMYQQGLGQYQGRQNLWGLGQQQADWAHDRAYFEWLRNQQGGDK